MKASTKACPGCGVKGLYRRADQCCSECKQLIKEAKAHRAHIARQRTVEAAKLPFASHCLPPIYSFAGEGADRVVQQFVFDLVHLVGEETSWQQTVEKLPGATYSDSGLIIKGQSGCDSSGSTYWLIPRGLKNLLNTLYAAIQSGAAFARQQGKEEGQSLVLGLANGETSIDDFNEASIGPELLKRATQHNKTRG